MAYILRIRLYLNFSIIFLLLFYSHNIFAQEKISIKQLSEMSFEDMLNMKINVSGAITHLSSAETPASVTLITEEQIKYSPARNILDLIEIYVPGAIWMNYEEGTQIGIRGLVANHNTKYLMLVNGRSMNNKGHFGAMSELEEWNLDDIYKIEIVRGSGSVTYGPGAIAGVINIITHNSSTGDELKINTNYVSRYNSKGLSISNNYIGKNFKLYTYSSITRTPGFRPRHYLVNPDNTAGYIGDTSLLDKDPLDYFADYRDNPQIKIYADVEFSGNWRFWTRYTQQGATWSGNEAKTEFDGEMLNQQSLQIRQFTATLTNEKKVKENLTISSMLSIGSSDSERIREGLRDPDPEHILNKQVDFGETGIVLNNVLDWAISEKSVVAIGFEFSRDRYGPAWGKDKKDMRVGEDGFIVSGPESNALRAENGGSADRNGTQLYVGNGWSTNTISLFSEVNLEIHPKFKILLSGRTDKNTYTDWINSPRLALISKIKEGHYIKLIAQKSVRMNSAGQLYTENQHNIESKTEKLKGIELIYNAYPKENLSFGLSAFRNNLDFIAWDFGALASKHVGILNLWGVEAEIKHKSSFGNIGASYSHVKQIDWTLADDVLLSGVSYADYKQPFSQIPNGELKGFGNDLGNWPNQSLKLYGLFTLNDRVTFHVNSRIVWDFQGAKDGFESLRSAVKGSILEQDVEDAMALVNNVNAYELDFRTNFSLSFKINARMELQFYGFNVIGKNNKRYSYDFGNIQPAPQRVRFIEEPRVFGLKFVFNR